MKFDFNQFLNRKGLKQQQAADLIGVTQATISNWCKGKIPDYETFSKLIGYGMTAQEMFGVEAGDELVRNSMNSRIIPSDYNTPGFRAAVMNIFAEIEKKKAAKAAGVQKDEEAVR